MTYSIYRAVADGDVSTVWRLTELRITDGGENIPSIRIRRHDFHGGQPVDFFLLTILSSFKRAL